MEYNLHFSDLKLIIKKNIKIILLFSIVFALLFGGFKMISSRTHVIEDDATREAIENYNDWSKYKNRTSNLITDELISAFGQIATHPVMSIDANNCTVNTIVFSFDPTQEVYRDSIVRNWINNMSTKSLFNKESDVLKKCRAELISVSGVIGEVTIRIIDVNEYDVDDVAKRIIKRVKESAEKAGIKISSYYDSKVTGFSQMVFDIQDALRNDVVKIINETNVLDNYSMLAPSDNNESGLGGIVGVLLFAGIGFFIGFIISIIYALFRIVMKGIVISGDQVNKAFSIKKIGETRLNNHKDAALINAVIKTISDNSNHMMMVSTKENDTFRQLASSLNDLNDNNYIFDTIEIDSVEKIDCLKSVDSIIIPITIGETTGKDIVSVVNWSNTFKKNILGYIIINK